MRKVILFITVCCFFCATAGQAERLKLLTWKGYAPMALIEKFKKETGITVEVTYSGNEGMIAKLRNTDSAFFDLAQPSQERIVPAQENYAIYQPIDYSRIDTKLFIPSILDSVKKYSRIGDEPFGVPFCWGASGLIVNSEKAPKADGWNALFDPEYKGSVSYSLDRTTLLAMGYALGYDPFALYSNPQGYKIMLDKVSDKLLQTRFLVRDYWDDGADLLESIRSGKVTVAMGWDNGGWRLHDENENFDFKAPKLGALGWIHTFAIPANAKNVDAAYKWVNFMMLPENAAVFSSLEKVATASLEANQYISEDIRHNFERSFPREIIDNIKWYRPLPEEIKALECNVFVTIEAAL